MERKGSEVSDIEAIERTTRRDSEALRILYDRHAPWLMVRLSQRCPNPTLVEEAVQDTFVAVWRSAHTYRGTGDVAAWIWGIGVRRLIDLVRRSPAAQHAAPPPDVASAEDRVLLGIEHGNLAGAVDALSPELRDVVRATILDGLTAKEAGRLLNIPTGTVKTRLMRARREMREALT